jgi:hypothetical protein
LLLVCEFCCFRPMMGQLLLSALLVAVAQGAKATWLTGRPPRQGQVGEATHCGTSFQVTGQSWWCNKLANPEPSRPLCFASVSLGSGRPRHPSRAARPLGLYKNSTSQSTPGWATASGNSPAFDPAPPHRADTVTRIPCNQPRGLCVCAQQSILLQGHSIAPALARCIHPPIPSPCSSA